MKETEHDFLLHPSDMKRQQIESNLEGVSIDWSDKDTGEEPIKADYSHIPDSGSNEPY